jgi:hypothetical protein
LANVTLHDLGVARDILDTWIEEHEGELLPELETLLEDLDCDVTEKAERVALYILECEATAAACREEAKRLTARGAARLNRADSLRGYLQSELARLGKKSIEATRVTITRQLNSVHSISCSDPAIVFLAESYDENDVGTAAPLVSREEKIVYHLNRAEIVRRHEAGDSLPAEIVVTRGEHVRIR